MAERDFARIAKYGNAEGRDRAKHYMTRPVVTARLSTSVAEVIKLMRKKNVRHLPVIDKRRSLVGIISSRDLMNTAMEIMLPSLR
ncbi:MAG: CBS domain-containing protein [Candidatus Bathyarchaeia archaeon]